MPTKTWVVGEEVLAADFNSLVQKQVVATFANAAARDAALPTPNMGMMCYLDDVRQIQVRRSTYWAPPVGAQVYGSMLAVPDINTTGTGVRDITGIAQGVTFPYPVNIMANAVIGVGYGSDWCAWRVDMYLYGALLVQATTGGAANAAMWSSSPMAAWYAVAANQSIGYKTRVNVDRFGSLGNNYHTDGQMVITAYAA